MAIDHDLLARHQAYQDLGTGFLEEFLQPEIGSGRTVAILSRPLERRRAVGWVICHSFAQEHYRLYRTDVAVARALASTGFPVLRYHGQGYGDSEGRMEDITLSSHLADARDAVRTMREQGLEAVGVIGTRFGGTIAAMVADELGAHALAVVDPVTSGREFMRVFLRTAMFHDVATEESQEGDPGRYGRELAETGWVDIRGFPLSRAAHDEIAGLDLRERCRRFRGAALVLGISRGNMMPRAPELLHRHLASLGADSTATVIREAHAGLFGQHHYRAGNRPDTRRDIQVGLDRKIARAVAGWAAALPTPGGDQA